MVLKILAVAIIAVGFVYVNSSLVDDAKHELDQLKAIVQGAIFAALDDIDRSNDDVGVYRDNLIEGSFLSIDEEFQILIEHLNNIKLLANLTGTNIGPCLQFQEPVLVKLNQTTGETLIDCVVDVNGDLEEIQANSKYKVDTLINEVGVYEFEIDRCGNSIICVEPILTQIELAMVKLPQKVRVEVDKIGELYDVIKDSFQVCNDNSVSHIAALGNDLINSIVYCIDHQLPHPKSF